MVEKVGEEFKQRYPQLDVAGYRNGYYTEEEEHGIADTIRDSKADMLFVGLSSPKKEKFLNRWMPMMQVPFCMGVGDSLISLLVGQIVPLHGCKRAVWNGVIGYTRNQEGCGSGTQKRIRYLCGW